MFLVHLLFQNRVQKHLKKLDDVPSDKETVKDYIDMFKSALGDEEGF